MSGLCTKILQGKIFKRFIEFIMGYITITYFIGNLYSPIKERVVNSEKNEVIGDSILTAEKY